MATKKLSPRARHLANPDVHVAETNAPGAREQDEADGRSKLDLDGNAEHARKRGSAERGDANVRTRH